MEKLTPEKAVTLIEVLNAQSGKARMADKEVYKAKLAEVADLVDKDKGGITADVYSANKDNAELVEAAKAHKVANKARAQAVKDKADKPTPEKGAQRTPEQEENSAKAIVAFMNAKAGVAKIEKTQEYMKVEVASRNYVDREKGGLKAAAYDRFKGFPGVKEASKAHREYFKKELKKDAPAM